MSIIKAIYNNLTANEQLAEMLAKDPLTDAPAIYEEWAHSEADMPYIVQSNEKRAGNHFAKYDALVTFDVFTDKGTINAETIRNFIVQALDRKEIDLDNNNAARFYFSFDQNIGDPEPKIIHWEVQFDVYFWRKNWLENSEE